MEAHQISRDMRLRGAIRRCSRAQGWGRDAREHTAKPSLRNSLAHRDRRRSVLKLLAGTSLSDSKAV